MVRKISEKNIEKNREKNMRKKLKKSIQENYLKSREKSNKKLSGKITTTTKKIVKMTQIQIQEYYLNFDPNFRLKRKLKLQWSNAKLKYRNLNTYSVARATCSFLSSISASPIYRITIASW